ncbi:MAG: AAA family ATPase, partial [Treponema sp.]|nr:AAA family ATPase [Treponema sp.]
FLYKIEFEKPNIDTRTAIIEYMLRIPKEDATAIAKDFELTGANIENIQRKMTTRNILYGEEYNFDRLLSYCKDEKIEKNKTMGFSAERKDT